jgi:hypothetical protein
MIAVWGIDMAEKCDDTCLAHAAVYVQEALELVPAEDVANLVAQQQVQRLKPARLFLSLASYWAASRRSLLLSLAPLPLVRFKTPFLIKPSPCILSLAHSLHPFKFQGMGQTRESGYEPIKVITMKMFTSQTQREPIHSACREHNCAMQMSRISRTYSNYEKKQKARNQTA